MVIYVFRHGAAEDHNAHGDSARRLTPKGRETVAELVGRMRFKKKPQVVLSSPYLRAMETAEIAARIIGVDGGVEKSADLFPGRDPKEIIAELNSRPENLIMLTGHNPHLSELVSALISSGRVPIQLKKASLACIEFDGPVREGEGILKWMVSPEILGL